MSGLIVRLLLFILPFILFFMVMKMLKNNIKDHEEKKEEFEKRIKVFSIIGIVALLVGIIFILLTTKHQSDQIYIPPKEVDGVIVPGHFKDKTD